MAIFDPVLTALETRGWFVGDDLLSPELVHALRAEG